MEIIKRKSAIEKETIGWDDRKDFQVSYNNDKHLVFRIRYTDDNEKLITFDKAESKIIIDFISNMIR